MKLQLFVSIVFTLFTIGGLHGVEWSEPECLADHGGQPTLLINNQHTLWCVAEPSILSHRDEVSGWQLETESTLGGTGTTWMSSPACFDKGDNLWMLKHNDWRIYYSRWDGGTWSGVATYPVWVGFAGIIADSGGCVWVGWSTNWWGWWKVAYNRYQGWKLGRA